MKLAIVISTNDAETCWNALRYANYAIGQKDAVKVFLMGKGVEYQQVSTATFDAAAQAEMFVKAGCKIYACGTCIKSRDQEGSEMCPVSTMKDMYDMIKESDKTVTF